MVNTEQAKNMRTKIDISGIIQNVQEPRSINLKAGGATQAMDCELHDDAGLIKVTLWGDDVKAVRNGSHVSFKNAYTNTFKGETYLQKGKYGSMIVVTF